MDSASLSCCKDVAAILLEFLSGFGQVDFLAELFEQRQSRAFFELFDLHGDRRLSKIQGFRCARIRQMAGDGLEYF
jgi:hypothetical protein